MKGMVPEALAEAKGLGRCIGTRSMTQNLPNTTHHTHPCSESGGNPSVRLKTAAEPLVSVFQVRSKMFLATRASSSRNQIDEQLRPCWVVPCGSAYCWRWCGPWRPRQLDFRWWC